MDCSALRAGCHACAHVSPERCSPPSQRMHISRWSASRFKERLIIWHDYERLQHDNKSLSRLVIKRRKVVQRYDSIGVAIPRPIPLKAQAGIRIPIEVFDPAVKGGDKTNPRWRAHCASTQQRRNAMHATHNMHTGLCCRAPDVVHAHRNVCHPAVRYRPISLATMPCCSAKGGQGFCRECRCG